MDLVLVPNSLSVRERRLVGLMLVRTEHRLVVEEVSLGGARPARLGVFPRPAQVLPEHQWECFARDLEMWSSTWEPHPDLLQQCVERTLQILCEAMGPRVGTTNI